jgi:hypothetical protein
LPNGPRQTPPLKDTRSHFLQSRCSDHVVAEPLLEQLPGNRASGAATPCDLIEDFVDFFDLDQPSRQRVVKPGSEGVRMDDCSQIIQRSSGCRNPHRVDLLSVEAQKIQASMDDNAREIMGGSGMNGHDRLAAADVWNAVDFRSGFV